MEKSDKYLCNVYTDVIDDILIASDNKEQHFQDLKGVCQGMQRCCTIFVPKLHMTLTTDASNFTMGVVLVQRGPNYWEIIALSCNLTSRIGLSFSGTMYYDPHGRFE